LLNLNTVILKLTAHSLIYISSNKVKHLKANSHTTINMSVSMNSIVVTNSSTYPGRTRHKWKGNSKMELKEIGWEGTDWINLAQDRDRGKVLSPQTWTLKVHCNFVIG